MCESSVSILNRHPRIYHTPLVMNHALLLSLICGRGDVVTRSILRLSADAYEMQLCEQGLARHGTALALATIPPAPAVGAPAAALDPVFALIVAHKQIMETVRATAAERFVTRLKMRQARWKKVSSPSKIRTNLICLSG